MTAPAPRRRLALGLQLALVAAPAALVLAVRDPFFEDSITQVLLAAALGLSWNLLCGYARQISVGHVAFFGIGAYTSTLFLLHLGLSPWPGWSRGGSWRRQWARCSAP